MKWHVERFSDPVATIPLPHSKHTLRNATDSGGSLGIPCELSTDSEDFGRGGIIPLLQTGYRERLVDQHYQSLPEA